MITVNNNIIPTQNSSSINTAPFQTTNTLYCSAQLTANGAASGTLKLQASNDPSDINNNPPTNWSDIPNASVIISGSGTFLIPIQTLCYEWVRLVYTNTGIGTISVVYKSIGD